MILGSLEAGDKTLTGYAQVSADLGVEISASGLNQRINEAGVELLQRILGKSMQLSQEKLVQKELLQRFSSVQILDSSYLALPKTLAQQYPGLGGRGAAGLKLWLNYDYLQGQIRALSLTAGREPDQKSRLHIQQAEAGSLHLFDLGFFKQEVFAELSQKEAYFISRYQVQTALYWEAEAKERLDFALYLRQSQADQLSLTLFLGEKVRVPVRLVAQRLPKKVAAARRRKAKAKAKKDGRRQPPTQQTLQLLYWVIFITNVPEEWLSVEQILLIYRLRWQIELIFKFWKSRAKLDQIGPYRLERVLCQCYARLTALVLFHFLVAPTFALHKQLSLPKAFSLLQHLVSRLLLSIANAWQDLPSIWQRFEHDLLRLAMQDKRKKSPSTYQLLLEAGL
jgi:ribosomal protein L21